MQNHDFSDCHCIKFINIIYGQQKRHRCTFIKIFEDKEGTKLKLYLNIIAVDPNAIIFIDNFCEAYQNYFEYLKNLAEDEEIFMKRISGYKSSGLVLCFQELKDWFLQLNENSKLYLELNDNWNKNKDE